MKRLFSLILSCLLVLSLVQPGFAASAEEAETGLQSGIDLLSAGDYQYEEQEPNNSRSQANTIGHDYTVTGTIIWDVYMEELVGSKYYDLSDWFKFTVSSASTVTLLAASKYIDDLEVEVCNSSGDTLYTMDSIVVTDGGNRVLALQETLTAGTYYLYVSGGKWETMSLLYDEYLLYLTIEPCTHQNVTGVVTAPTCTEEGYTTYTCVCGYRYRDDYTPAKGHTPQILSGKKATCTETGLTEGKYCSDCGVTLTAQSSIPALGHRFGVWEVETPSSCTETGVYVRKCLRCDAEETEEMPICSHKYGTWIWETEPTCEKEGSQYLQCSLCGDRKTETVPALGHSYGEWDIDPVGSCGEDGFGSQTCTRCGHSIGGTASANDHAWSPWVTVKEPTCTELGSKERFCLICDTVEQQTVAKNSHSIVTVPGYGATCGKPGLTDGAYCSVCGTVTATQKTIAQLDHVFQDDARGFDVCIICGLCMDSLISSAKTIPLGDGGNYHVYPDLRLYLKFEIPEQGVVTVYSTEMLLKNYSAGRAFCTILDENGYELYRNSNYVVETVDTEQNDHTFRCGLEAGTYYLRVAAPDCHDYDLGHGLISDGILKDTGPHVKITFEALSDWETESNATRDNANLLTPGQAFSGYLGTDWMLDECRDTFVIQAAQGHEYTVTITTNQSELGDTENLRLGSSIWNGETSFRHSISRTFTADSTGPIWLSIEKYGQQVQYTVNTTETHQYTSEIVPPTCLEQGYTLYTCPCGDSYQENFTDALNPEGHTEQVLSAREATCSQTGLSEGVGCSTCGAVLVPQEETPALPHTEVVLEKTAPTCTETGLTEGRVCSVCHTVVNEQLTIPALGHAVLYLPRENATCTETGLTAGKICIRCGIYTQEQEIIPMLNHSNLNLPYRSATCLEPGLTEGKQCKVCGTITQEQEIIPQLEHFMTTVWGIEPTCTESGYTDAKQCAVCKTVLIPQEVSPAKGHTEEVTPGRAATCTQPGLTEGRYCRVCGETISFQEQIPATGHSEETLPRKAPSCTESGLTEGRKCSVCGEILIPQETLSALGHAYAYGICTRCGEEDPGYGVLSGVIRIAGDDRIATSLMLAAQLKEVLRVEKFDAVVVASALNFPDALTGSYLAAEKKAPILLTYPAAHAKIRAYIQENLKSGGMVYILGGEGAVSADFANGLGGFNIKRLAGSDRFGTNLEIMKEAGNYAGKPVLIATAVNFADSLSASAAGLPMVLVYGSLREDQKEFLATTSKNFIIIGGEAAVSPALEAELKAIGSVTRVAGSSRYETSVLVAERFVQNPDAVILAYAKNFPDGLCGGPLAYALGVPLILTDSGAPGTADEYVENITAGIVVGGAGLISDAATRDIFDLAASSHISTK